MASQIFGGSTGSRLWMRLRERDGFSYGVWGGLYPGDEDPVGNLVMGAILAPQNLAKARAAFAEEITRLRDQGVTADEVALSRFGTGAWSAETTIDLGAREAARQADRDATGLTNTTDTETTDKAAEIVAKVAAPTGDGPITFDMYMTVRNVPVQRRAGMRAFTTVQSATLADWNRIFRSY